MLKTNPDISIIIVNYNTFNEIVKCINSIKLYQPVINYEIIIVDNNSKERDIDTLTKIFPEIILIFSKENNGFGAGCNIGARKAKGKYLLFLNPDTIMKGNIFDELYEFMNKTTEAIAISPNFKYPNGQQGYVFNYFPNLIWEVYDLLGRGYKYRINKFNKKIIKAAAEKKAINVDWLTGACLLVKSESFFFVNGFDENFFLYYEDVDIQLRMKSVGGEIYCLPYLEVIHLTNASTKSKDDDYIYYYNIYRSKLIFINKHFNFFKKFSFISINIFGLILRLFLLNLRKRYKNNRKQKRKLYCDVLKLYLKNEFSKA